MKIDNNYSSVENMRPIKTSSKEILDDRISDELVNPNFNGLESSFYDNLSLVDLNQRQTNDELEGINENVMNPFQNNENLIYDNVRFIPSVHVIHQETPEAVDYVFPDTPSLTLVKLPESNQFDVYAADSIFKSEILSDTEINTEITMPKSPTKYKKHSKKKRVEESSKSPSDDNSEISLNDIIQQVIKAQTHTEELNKLDNTKFKWDENLSSKQTDEKSDSDYIKINNILVPKHRNEDTSHIELESNTDSDSIYLRNQLSLDSNPDSKDIFDSNFTWQSLMDGSNAEYNYSQKSKKLF